MAIKPSIPGLKSAQRSAHREVADRRPAAGSDPDPKLLHQRFSLFERRKATLRAAGIKADIEPDGSIDIESFVAGARKRWSKVIDQLAE